ncbi:MAG TPA: hypothetical protein VKS81_10240, partial [Bacteroidota bacterium]|nr:hypothetical protein [Bacteroidota bacterium]
MFLSGIHVHFSLASTVRTSIKTQKAKQNFAFRESTVNIAQEAFTALFVLLLASELYKKTIHSRARQFKCGVSLS